MSPYQKQPRNKPHVASKSPTWSPDEPYWLYGLHPVLAALQNPRRKQKKLVATRNAARSLEEAGAGDHLVPEIVERRAIDKLVPADAVHQGVALLVAPLPEARLNKLLDDPDTKRLVVLDQVTDPHNVGAIFRSAAAFGATAIVTTRRHAPNETAVLVKAAAGTFEIMPYVRLTNLSAGIEKMKEALITIVGLDGHAPADIASVSGDDRIALVLGAEGKGMREKTKGMCDHLVRLPINPAVESLNVSNAAAVALYALAPIP